MNFQQYGFIICQISYLFLLNIVLVALGNQFFPINWIWCFLLPLIYVICFVVSVINWIKGVKWINDHYFGRGNDK